MIPSTLVRPGAASFWLAVLLTGVGTGVAAAALTRLLETVQHTMWNGAGATLLDAAEHARAWRHNLVLLAAGVVTGVGQILHAGRMPVYRSSISSVASVGYVRLVTWADRNKPRGWRRLTAPLLGLALLGAVSIWFRQLLGNGRDISQLEFTNQVAPALLLTRSIYDALLTDKEVEAGQKARELPPR